MNDTADVVVIGGGIGGLCAAAILGARGKRVILCEQHASLGGKLGTVLLDGIACDTGPSVLTLPDVLDRVFRAASGRALSEHITLTTPTPAFMYHYPSGLQLAVHHRVDDTLASIEAAMGRTARDELTRFLVRARRIWDASKDAFVFAAAPSVGGLATLALTRPRDMLAIDALRSMHAAICSDVKTPELQWLLMRYATYNGSDVRAAPATLNCIAHVELGLGGFGIRGGMRALVDALAAVLTAVNVEVRVGCSVARIVTSGRRVSGVVLSDGNTIHAKAVVANADAAHVADELLQDTQPPPIRPMRQLSMSGANLIVRARPSTLTAAHTVIFPSDYLAEFADLFDAKRAPRDPTLYICAQARAHDGEVWAGGEPAFVMANAPATTHTPGDTVDAAEGEGLLQTMQGKLLVLGVIGSDDDILWRRTPHDLARLYPGTGGALYGAASNSRMAAFERPKNRIAALPGLYLASGSAHPGGGVPLCAQSGVLAAQAVLDDNP